MILKFLKASLATGFTLFALSSHAALVTLQGTSVNYVYDSVANADAMLLFGTPGIQGNTVLFNPNDFRAQSDNGQGIVEASATFVFKSVYSTNGAELTGISVREFGDYKIDTGGTNGEITGDLLLYAVNNAAWAEGQISSGDAVNAAGDSLGRQNWTMDATINPMDDYDAVATDILVGIQNTLTATTSATGETAWIQKKLTFVAVSEVPVPAAAWLFGSALLGLVGVARRKHS